MKVSEMILLTFFAVFAGVLLFNSLDMPYSSEQGFGAGFVPLNMSVVIIILTAVIALRALLSKNRTQVEAREASVDSNQAPESDQQQSFVAPVSTIVLLLAATAVMGFGSILVPLGILMMTISAFFLGNSWFNSIRMTIVSLAVIYLIFSVWLKIPLT